MSGIKVDIYVSVTNPDKMVAIKSGTDVQAFCAAATDSDLKQLRWIKTVGSFGRGGTIIGAKKGLKAADIIEHVKSQGWSYC